MKKIELTLEQFRKLDEQVGPFFLDPSNSNKVIKKALFIKKIPRIYVNDSLRFLTKKKLQDLFISEETKLEEQKFIARRLISLAKSAEDLLEVYRCFVRILILISDDETPENILVIRKMAKIMFKK